MDKQIIKHIRILIALFAVLCALVVVFGTILAAKVERMTAVSESLNQKAADIMTATAPLGHEAVNKGVQVLQNVDTHELGQSATSGVKEIGKTLKESATDWIKKRANGSGNSPTTQSTSP
jgi:hypothetical protein